MVVYLQLSEVIMTGPSHDLSPAASHPPNDGEPQTIPEVRLSGERAARLEQLDQAIAHLERVRHALMGGLHPASEAVEHGSRRGGGSDRAWSLAGWGVAAVLFILLIAARTCAPL